MSLHEVILRGRETVAERTIAFRFSKPAGFQFFAGQAVEIELVDPVNPLGDVMKHVFSLANATRETDLTIATRMRDSQFKRALGTLRVGAHVRLEGPFGTFALDRNRARPAVFVAGGIGITPFRSMLRDELERPEGIPIILFYSNPRPEDAAFLDELQALAVDRPRLTLVATMTKMENSSVAWSGEIGRITPEFILRITRNVAASPIYYVVGPPAMVGGIREMLASIGAHDSDVRSEEFFGY
jgi:ferredoxin-NADP reductase